MMKQMLIALGLTLGGAVLQAQPPQSLKAEPADTLLVIEEEALLRSLQQLATQAAEAPDQPQVDQEDLMKVLRYQLMLSLLAPKEPSVIYHVAPYGYPMGAGASSQTDAAKLAPEQEVRLARLERILEVMLTEKNTEKKATPVKVVTKQPISVSRVDSLALKQQQSINSLEAKLAEAEARLKSLETTPQKDLNLPALTEGLGLNYNAQTVIHATDTIKVTNRVEVATDFKRSVYFNVGSAVVDTLAARTLDEVVIFLSDYPEAVLVLNGFASPEGNAAYNKQLADRRLAAVVSYLGSKGVDTKTKLVAGKTGIDRSRSGFQLARRVDISLKILSNTP